MLNSYKGLYYNAPDDQVNSYHSYQTIFRSYHQIYFQINYLTRIKSKFIFKLMDSIWPLYNEYKAESDFKI